MDIHKPKAAHSWREFAIEIGTIILGILIALSLEQGVEELRWNERVAVTREQLNAELKDDAASGLIWISVGRCLDQQLDTLSEHVWTARSTGTFAPLASPYAPPLEMFLNDAWLNARSLQVSDHLSSDEVGNYSTVYFFPAELKDNVIALHQAAAALEPLSRKLDRVTAEEADQFIGRISQAREMQFRMIYASLLLIQSAERVGVSAEVGANRAANVRRHFGSCALDQGHIIDVLHSARGLDALARLGFRLPAVGKSHYGP
ncbi:MAG TPA: hypothetical protein VJ476_05120 [Rhizomicrobium sp.]|nr:hypothetical protein [Rhizomicrobium sp.]